VAVPAGALAIEHGVMEGSTKALELKASITSLRWLPPGGRCEGLLLLFLEIAGSFDRPGLEDANCREPVGWAPAGRGWS